MVPIWINISLFIGCLVETRNYSIISVAFIASSFRVTEENLVFETVQSGPYSSFECFHCSLRNYFIQSILHDTCISVSNFYLVKILYFIFTPTDVFLLDVVVIDVM